MKNLIKKLAGKPLVRTYHAVQSQLADALYRNPGRGMKAIGVTGTNGKTTTANLIASIFETAGYKVALLSTIQMRINGQETMNETKMTVPAPFDLNKFLRRAKQAGCEILIVEATSHALDQHRFLGVQFDTGVLTNITHDHLDYHGTFEHYVQAKRRLFARGLRLSVINLDDPASSTFINLPADVHLNYSLTPGTTGALYPKNVKSTPTETRLTIALPGSDSTLEVETALPGTFNQANILAAVAVALGHGVSPDHIRAGIKRLTHVPGRMERVESGQKFTVIIDYAHTPDALEKMYAALAPLKTGKMISVLGATGDRDKTKRPILGQIAGREADYVMVTNEDPWTEDPSVIIDSVAMGVPTGRATHQEGTTYWRILDRGEAIKKALELAQPGDIVTITGKGAETGMGIGKKIIPWSDREIALEGLAQRRT